MYSTLFRQKAAHINALHSYGPTPTWAVGVGPRVNCNCNDQQTAPISLATWHRVVMENDLYGISRVTRPNWVTRNMIKKVMFYAN